MTTTVVAVFDQYEEARAAREDLAELGLPESDVNITANESTGASTEHISVRGDGNDGESTFGERVAHFFRSLFSSDEDEDYAGHYSEAVRRGSCVLTVSLQDESQSDRVTEVLARHDAVDIEQRAEQWRGSGWTGYDAAATPMSEEEIEQDRQFRAGARTEPDAMSLNAADTSGIGSAAARSAGPGTGEITQETTLPVIEEEMKVGKRVQRSGGVRVYTRTTERPVEEQVNLREEIATVERRPVDRPVTDADAGAFREQSIEVTETAEEPVISKTARVVEEVVVGKAVRERTETVGDIVRRTDVEVEQLDSAQQTNLDPSRLGVRDDSDKAPVDTGKRRS